MKLLVAFAAVILSTSALSATEHWENFKVTHNKFYKNSVEERVRFGVFQANLKRINEHNEKYARGESGYKMGVNQFADITPEEFKAKLGVSAKNMPKLHTTRHVPAEDAVAPDAIDWRQKGAVLEVKDQGNCGSCWAFSTTGSLEGQNKLVNNKSVSLSEQQLLDCSTAYGNGDCDEGGLMTYGFKYIQDNGLESEADYPYEEEQGKCRSNADKAVVHIKGYKEVDADEESLRQAIGTVGPISAAIYADPIQFYDSGIFDDKECYSDSSLLDHGILAVGYGTEGDKPYWIIKNSWGKYWGEKGYFRLKRGEDLCGLSLMTSYPVL